MPAERFELPTFGLQNRCTTTVLSRPTRVSLGIAPMPVNTGYAERAKGSGSRLHKR